MVLTFAARPKASFLSHDPLHDIEQVFQVNVLAASGRSVPLSVKSGDKVELVHKALENPTGASAAVCAACMIASVGAVV